MSDELFSDFGDDTTASETQDENTQPSVNHDKDPNSFPVGKSEIVIDDDLKKLSEENDNHRIVDSFENRDILSLEKDPLTSSLINDEKSENFAFHINESSSEFDQKTDIVLSSPLVKSDVRDLNDKNNFSDISNPNEDKEIVCSDSPESPITTKAYLSNKKVEQVNNGDLNSFETINKEPSNNIEYINDYNLCWQSAFSPTSFRRWESDPAIESEADGPIEEQRFPVIYRLSLKYSKVFQFNVVEKIHVESVVDKAGFLQKLSGRGFPYLNQWKRRYCVLSKGRLYLYEKESNKASDKCTSIIDLKYFDHVTEAMQKDSKKVSNVFVVTSQDRSFFDPGRHLFAADTLTEMHDWIAKLRESIELIRNNNRPTKGVKTQQSKRDSQGLPTEENQEEKQSLIERAHHQGTDVAVASADVVDAREIEAKEEFKIKQEFTSSLKKKLKIESPVDQGDEESSEKEIISNDENQTVSLANFPSVKKVSSTTISLQNPSLSLDTKPQLESITKNRIRGPAGRRAPQLRRTIMMKERASSMSALQQEGLTDNDARSEIPHGVRASTLTADGVLLADPSPNLSKSSGMNLADNDMNTSFDDIESALFFRRPSPLRDEPSDTIQKSQDKKKKSTFSFRNFRISKTPSEKNTKEKTFSIFRSNTFKFRAFRSSNSAADEHPDNTTKNKICSIL